MYVYVYILQAPGLSNMGMGMMGGGAYGLGSGLGAFGSGGGLGGVYF